MNRRSRIGSRSSVALCLTALALATVTGCPEDTTPGAEFCAEGDRDGKAIPEQIAGDCQTLVCDGSDATRPVADAADIDDGKPCTAVECRDEVAYVSALALAPCYDGAEGTDGVGECHAGTMACTDGEVTGTCEGQVIPVDESCLTPGDEDCDGETNEEGEGCICSPAASTPCYEGPAGTENVGLCVGGTHVCAASGASFGTCDGQVTPVAPTCTTYDDEDCDGVLPDCNDLNTTAEDGCSPDCLYEIVDVQAGNGWSCALFSFGKVKCWGVNSVGQLGLGTPTNSYLGDAPGEMAENLPFLDLGTGAKVAQLSVGSTHACVILDDGKVKCWGSNQQGQLGLGDTSNRGDSAAEMGDGLPTLDLGAGKTATSISAGESSTCAILNDGKLKCWGYNAYGQLGLGDNAGRGDAAGEMGNGLPSVDLGTGRTAASVDVGSYYTCAVLDDASLKCWGYNAYGQLGLGDMVSRGDAAGEMGDALPKVDLGVGKTAVSIATDATYSAPHTCAVLTGGQVKCWGYNGSGELGLGDGSARGDAPSEMGDNLPVVALGTGKSVTRVYVGGYHSCALLDDETVKCWGAGGSGQLGQGSSAGIGSVTGQMGDQLAPIGLGTGRTVITVTAGQDHTCARLDNGTLKCWGANNYGQLGLGVTTPRGNSPGQMGDALPIVTLLNTAY